MNQIKNAKQSTAMIWVKDGVAQQSPEERIDTIQNLIDRLRYAYSQSIRIYEKVPLKYRNWLIENK